jgi:hypothetical protein
MSDETWYYVQDGASIGPIPRPAVDALIRAGSIRADTLVSPGYGDWVAAGSTALAPMFAYGAVPPVPPVPQVPPAFSLSGAKAKWDFLPKDPRMRRVVQVVIILIGLYAIYDGIGNIGLGMKELTGDTSVRFMGCNGISAEAVQCGFQNMAQENRELCMDVVILCTDGRHVASTCSEKMLPGATSTKVVNNFSPAVNASVQCQNITYENVKTKG